MGMPKVTLCLNGNTIVVAEALEQVFLNLGATEGACTTVTL